MIFLFTLRAEIAKRKGDYISEVPIAQIKLKLLRMNKVVQTVSAPGQPHDNTVMESFFSFMKREEIYRTQYKSEQQFVKSVDNSPKFYNTQRPHGTLNYKTPNQFEAIHEGKMKSAII